MLERGEDPPRGAAVQPAAVGERRRRRGPAARRATALQQLGRPVDRLDPLRAVDRGRHRSFILRDGHRTIRTRTDAVDFTYTPEQLELRARARALADDIMVHEEACEEADGLPPDVHREVAERVRHHGLNAINMPAEWGGAGPRRARPGDRAGAARAAHQRAVGHGLAPGERAARVRRRPARALPAARHPRRAARLRGGHRARRRLGPDARSPRPPSRRPTAATASTARSGSSRSATSPTT